MIRNLVGRATEGLAVLWILVTVTFLALRVTGDPITAAFASSGASQAEIQAMREAAGYDRPILEQYWDHLAGLFSGDFGDSFRYGSSATDLVLAAFPYTAYLALAALAISLVVALPCALVAALAQGSGPDRLLVNTFSMIQSVPNFVLGPLLILFFAVFGGWLPVSGVGTWKHLILPAITLAAFPTVRLFRLMRASVLDIRSSDHVRAARARGVMGIPLVVKHIARNSVLPVIPLVGIELSGMLGGAVVVESIFGWPGLGSLALTSIAASDFPVVEFIVILVAVIVVALTFVTDSLMLAVDPRIRALDG